MAWPVNGPLAKLLEVPAYAMPVRFPWAKSSVFLYFVAVGLRTVLLRGVYQKLTDFCVPVDAASEITSMSLCILTASLKVGALRVPFSRSSA